MTIIEYYCLQSFFLTSKTYDRTKITWKILKKRPNTVSCAASLSSTTKYKRIDAAKIRFRARHKAGILIIKILSTIIARGVKHPVVTGGSLASLGIRKKWFGSELIRFMEKLDSCSSSRIFLSAGIISVVICSVSAISRSIIWISLKWVEDPLISLVFLISSSAILTSS